GTPQDHIRHQSELHLCLGELGVFQACRNQIGATEACPGQIRMVEARLLCDHTDQLAPEKLAPLNTAWSILRPRRSSLEKSRPAGPTPQSALPLRPGPGRPCPGRAGPP